MSYYTFFYPPKGLYNERNLSIEEINKEIKRKKDSIGKTKILLKGDAISAYYTKTTKEAIDKLNYLFYSLKYELELINKYEWVVTIDSDMKEYKSVAINHANCHSKYELQDEIDVTNKYISRLFSDLIVLTRVKFTPSKNYGDNYRKNDEEKNEMEYLMGEYQIKINQILDSLEEAIEEKSKNQFMFDCFDGHKGEADLENETKEVKEDNKTDLNQNNI